MPGRNGGADHDAVETQVPGQRLRRQARDAFAHQRAPRDRGCDRSEDRIARRSRTKRFEKIQEQRFSATVAHGFQHRLGARIVRLGGGRRKQRARILVDLDRAQIKSFVAGVEQAGMGKEIDQPPRAGESPLDPLGSDDRGCRGHDRIGRVTRFARRLSGHQCRVADQVGLRRNRNIEHGAIVLARDLVHERQREIRFQRQERELEDGTPVDAGDLRLRIHHRRAGSVLHVLARDHRPDLAAQRLDLGAIGRGRLDRTQRELRRQLYALIVRNPRLERKAAADMRDVAHHRALG